MYVKHGFQIQDLTILEEVLRMVLEIINSCLTHRLAHNPNLIYTLLYKKDIFQPFRMHSAFQDIVQNIDSVSINIEYLILLAFKLYIHF